MGLQDRELSLAISPAPLDTVHEQTEARTDGRGWQQSAKTARLRIAWTR